MWTPKGFSTCWGASFMEFSFSYNRFDPVYEEKLGTILTLANGRIGVRGELELYKSAHGTLVNGVYNDSPVFHREIVNLPRVTGVYLIVDNVPVSLETSMVNVERILDIGKGLVRSRARLCSGGPRCIDYESIRIVHKTRKDIAGLRITIKSGEEARITVMSTLEYDIANPQIPDSISIKHYQVELSGFEGDTSYVLVKTLDGRYSLAFAMTVIPMFPGYRLHPYKSEGTIGFIVSFTAEPGVEYELLKLASITRSIEGDSVLERANSALQGAIQAGWEKLVEEHVAAWRESWSRIELDILGDRYLEKLLRFNAFHLLQLIDEKTGELSIPAKGLHGLGYRGHVFWDTEIYTLPFYLLYDPSIAKKVLKYRCNRMKQAIEHAKSLGYRGARFPWESADDGYEATPRIVSLDLAGRRRVRIWTGDEEEHITADIAYAVDYYYRATLDSEFMEECGLKLIFETARYWTSRVEYDESRDVFVIRKVMGPDEYHAHVDNSFYTNVMVRHNLRLAAGYYELSLRNPKWLARVAEVGVTEGEVKTWRQIAEKLYIPKLDGDIYEEFEGYSKLEDYIKEDQDCIGEGCIPHDVLERISDTRLIKQADVILAMLLLEDEFSLDELKENFNYYYPRTTHGSSLSIPAYAMAASRIGYTSLAYKLLKKAASADVEDVYGNVEHGLHVASSGGVWMAMVKGFLDLSIVGGRAVVGEPRIPSEWCRVSLKLGYWDSKIDVSTGQCNNSS